MSLAAVAIRNQRKRNQHSNTASHKTPSTYNGSISSSDRDVRIARRKLSTHRVAIEDEYESDESSESDSFDKEFLTRGEKINGKKRRKWRKNIKYANGFVNREFPPKGPRAEKAEENHAKYRKKNKIDQLDGDDGVYRASSSANVVLYVGLGMAAIGLVITFVGLGEKGFRTLELKLIGPSLVGCGVFFALLRVLFCTIPSCFRSIFRCCCRKQADKKSFLNDKSRGKSSRGSSSGAVNSAFGAETRRVAPSRDDFASKVVSLPPIENKKNLIEKSSQDIITYESNKILNESSSSRKSENETTKEQKNSNASTVSRNVKTAKPIKYDNYSSDSDDSSVFSFPDENIEPHREQEQEEAIRDEERTVHSSNAMLHNSLNKLSDDFSIDLVGERKKSVNHEEVVLNASTLQYEKEKEQ